jgi:hypothetical protein
MLTEHPLPVIVSAAKEEKGRSRKEKKRSSHCLITIAVIIRFLPVTSDGIGSIVAEIYE